MLLDQYHIPIISSLIALSILMYYAFEIDHYYKVKEYSPDNDDDYKENHTRERKKDVATAIKERLKNQPKNDKTLVVIAASGGGIQATAWMVKVLGELQQELGQSFTQAIGLISSVSGSSVGTMFFLDRVSENGFPEQNDFEHIFQSSTTDCLDAVGWGLAGPDLIRLVFPFLVNRYIDRGSAMETKWKQKMKKPNVTLADMRKKILDGKIPIPVFNATLVEDGRRFLISPMTFVRDNDDADNRKAFDFNTLFQEANGTNKIFDLDITTAARLSASFPYVSPVARNDGNHKYNYHVADGGYFDNSGMVTVVEWLNRHIYSFYNELKIKKILIVEINAFPKQLFPNEEKGKPGWFMKWIAPLQAVYNVRDSTQISRGLNEIELLKLHPLVHEKKVDLQNFSIYFPADNNKGKLFQQPLSWKLTKHQKENIVEAWSCYKQDNNNKNFNELVTLWKGWMGNIVYNLQGIEFE